MKKDGFLDKITKGFILNEVHSPDAKTYLQSLSDIVEQMKPSSIRDRRRIQLAKENISKLRNQFRHIEERVNSLEEQLRVIEESKEPK
jgi:predicted RNase H-like nuclease (RuvC/YqgF family)|tara:strand:+ start:546 stop:809 length:264 start_codon:yes stop_codon:yes gene_type:complete